MLLGGEADADASEVFETLSLASQMDRNEDFETSEEMMESGGALAFAVGGGAVGAVEAVGVAGGLGAAGAPGHAGKAPASRAGGPPGWGESSWVNFVVVTGAFSADNLAAPFAFRLSGWATGLAILAYAAGSTYYSGLLLGRQAVAEGGRASYPRLALVALGKPGFRVTLALQAASYFLLVVVLLVKLAEFMSLGLRHSGLDLCLPTLVAVASVVVAVLVQVPTFRHVVPIAGVALFVSILRLALVLLQVMLYDMASTCEPDYGTHGLDQPSSNSTGVGGGPGATGVGLEFAAGTGSGGEGADQSFGQSDPTHHAYSFFLALSTFAWLFGGHGMYPEEVREMRNAKADFGKALNWAYVVLLAQYLLALVPYAVFGSWTSPRLVDNLPDDGITTAVAWLSVAWAAITSVIGCLALCLTVEVHVLGLSPLVHWTPALAVGDCPGGGFCGGMPPWCLRAAHRCAMVGLLLGAALALQDAGLMGIQALMGAFGFGAFTFWLPFLLALRLSPRRRALHAALLCLGLLLSAGGVYTAIRAIAHSESGSLFALSCPQVQLKPGGPCAFRHPHQG